MTGQTRKRRERADAQWHETVTAADWDAALFAGGGHFLQSSHWFAFQSALHRPTYFARGDGWSCASYVETGAAGSRLYCPYGPSVGSGDALADALAALSGLAARIGVTHIRVEPFGDVSEQVLLDHGLRRAAKDNQPSLTWVRDLRGTAEDLLAGMYKSNRARYRSAAERGLAFRTSTDPDDVETFLAMAHEVAARAGIRTHPDDYFRTMARALMPRGVMTLYLALHAGDPVASVLVFDSPAVRYTVHSGSFPVARKLHAASPLRTQIILDAQRAGQRRVDFWGVAPAGQPDHRWSGFTRFKQSFGGDYLQYSGTWELQLADDLLIVPGDGLTGGHH